MKPYLLKESHWGTISDNTYDLAVLPWGATEAHNRHLPYGTDIYESDLLSEAAAEVAWSRGASVVVLPTIPFGVNTGQADVLLDINLNPSTQLAIVRDVITVLNRQGIRRLLIFNSHGGNSFKPIIRELGLEFPEMFLAACNWFEALDKSRYFTHPGDHADEMETSLMLHLLPELVRPLDEAGDGRAKRFVIEALNQGWTAVERKWSSVTQDTGIGDPRSATGEKGELFMRDLVSRLADLFYDLATHRGGWYR